MSDYAYDTTVQCKKCGRKQHLDFVNGLKNGWSTCCGETMPIVYSTVKVAEAVQKITPIPKKLKEEMIKELQRRIWKDDLRMTIKEKPWSVS